MAEEDEENFHGERTAALFPTARQVPHFPKRMLGNVKCKLNVERHSNVATKAGTGKLLPRRGRAIIS